MSTVSETAELEAKIAEAELSDEEAELVKATVGEGLSVDDAIAAVILEREPQASASGEQPAPGEQLGDPSPQQLKALDRATDRHLAKVREIMGGHVADFEACAECGGIGLVPPGPTPREHPYFKTCDTCDGFGKVKTGSLDPQHATRDCPGCKGRGYLEALDPSGMPLAAGGGAQPAPLVAPPASNGETPPAPAAPASSELNFGTPAWMGDTSLSR